MTSASSTSVFRTEIQPSPRRAARRRPARKGLRRRSESGPPEPVGPSDRSNSVVRCRGSSTNSPVHTRRMISIASLVRAPRVAISCPNHANSSGIQLRPTPSPTRLPDSTAAELTPPWPSAEARGCQLEHVGVEADALGHRSHGADGDEWIEERGLGCPESRAVGRVGILRRHRLEGRTPTRAPRSSRSRQPRRSGRAARSGAGSTIGRATVNCICPSGGVGPFRTSTERSPVAPEHRAAHVRAVLGRHERDDRRDVLRPDVDLSNAMMRWSRLLSAPSGKKNCSLDRRLDRARGHHVRPHTAACRTRWRVPARTPATPPFEAE